MPDTLLVEYQDRLREINRISEWPFFSQDLIRLCLGDRLGSGAYRCVYDFDLVPNTVIKIAESTEANTNEWAIWKAVKNTDLAKWFAPCIAISPTGHFLIQRKVRPIKESDKLPKYLPNFTEDIKRANFGFIGKQLVWHDYQFLDRLIDIAANSGKRLAEWDK